MNGGFELVDWPAAKGLAHTIRPTNFNCVCRVCVDRTWNIRFYDTPKFGRFFMTKFDDEFIEDALAKVRADFEKRGNEFGLEILDGCEAQWDATGQISDGQLDWLERQLNGNWRQARKRHSLDVVQDGAKRKHVGGSHDVQATSQARDGSLDALIREKLGARGEVVVDLTQLDELDAAVDDLKQTIKALRDCKRH